MEKLNYKDLRYKDLLFDGKKWTDESIQMMKDMLEVWDAGHGIIICHPNKVFSNKPISKSNNDINCIDWLDVTSEFLSSRNDWYVNIYPEMDQAWRYIHRRFRHEIFDNKKIQQPRHLAVVEYDRSGGCLVRGIFRADEQSIKVAENPIYTEYKPKSIWDKQLRWTAVDEISLIEYLNEMSGSDSEPPTKQ